jgi:hypothetical protein
VPHAQVPELVASADVVVDQVMTGSYGVAAVEAMAAGRLVVGNVAPEVRALVPDPVPVVDAPPERLESVLRQILSDPSSYHATAVEGVQFAHRWHDGRAAALALDTHFLAAAPDTT